MIKIAVSLEYIQIKKELNMAPFLTCKRSFLLLFRTYLLLLRYCLYKKNEVLKLFINTVEHNS